MRKLKSGLLTIEIPDEPGAGGANHVYCIEAPQEAACRPVDIYFQNGPVKENGVNGITQEALLAIVIDRLQCFQKGPFACRDNDVALTKCEEALMWLEKRTRDRESRGVEGTNKI